MRWWAGRQGPRRCALAQAPPGPLRDCLAVPWPGPGTDVARLRLLALDLETTGLDPARDRILSVGYVPVDGLRIDLSGARHLVVAADGEVGRSATIHGLTDDAVAAGVPLQEAMTAVLGALAGRVLLAHHAPLERGFLSQACARLWGAELPVLAVDTLEQQRRLVTSAWRPEPPPGALRLWSARRRFGLPVYRAHDALADALGCAELYLAQVAERGRDGRGLTLRHLLS